MPPTSFDIGFSLNPCPRKLGAPQADPNLLRADLRDLRRDSTIKTLENFRAKVLRELGKLKIS